MLIEEIDETQYEEEVLKSNNIVLIYFYAEWVELCKIQEITFETFSKVNT